jgi:hypothetical protein
MAPQGLQPNKVERTVGDVFLLLNYSDVSIWNMGVIMAHGLCHWYCVAMLNPEALRRVKYHLGDLALWASTTWL